MTSCGVTFGAPLPRLHGHHTRVPFSQLVQVQLVLPLDRGEPLQGVELVGEGADEGCLAGVLQTCDDDVLAGVQRGTKKGGQRRVEGSEQHEVVEISVPDPVAADDHLWARCRPGHGCQATAVVQP